MNDKIKCPACEREIKATAKHCGFCGAKIEISHTETPIPVNSTTDTEVPSSIYENPVPLSPGRRGVIQTIDSGEKTDLVEIDKEPKKVETTAGKKCISCGQKMPLRAKFCGVCGGVLIDITEEINEDTNESERKFVREEIADDGDVLPSDIYDNGDIEDDKSKYAKENSDEAVYDADFSKSTGLHPDFKPAGDL